MGRSDSSHGQSIGLFLILQRQEDQKVLCGWLIGDSLIDLAPLRPTAFDDFERLLGEGKKPPCPVVVMPQVTVDERQIERLAKAGICIVLLIPEASAFNPVTLEAAIRNGGIVEIDYEAGSNKLSELLCLVSKIDREVQGRPLLV